MPDDLLRFIGPPTGYSLWWLLPAGLLLAVAIAWGATIYVWTMPADQLRTMRISRGLHGRLVRRRFSRTVDEIRASYRSGALTAGQASAAISATVRSFLSLRTGDRAQYMHVGDLAAGRLAPAAPLVAALNNIQFSTESQLNVDAVAESAQELIRSWT